MGGEEAVKKKTLFNMFISVVVLGGCSTTADHQFELYTNFTTGVKPFKVNLEVKDGNLINDRHSNTNCANFAPKLRKGCFVAEFGEMLELKFALKHRSDNKKWRFAKLQICAGTTKPIPSSSCSLNPDQQADWLVVANNEVTLMPSNGTVDLTQFADELRIFSVRDFNWHKGDFTYRIQACEEEKTADDDCVWMDPGGTNNGRGR
jgi:hypothetical protein